MSNELFKEHHPHRLSDYFARSTVGFGRNLTTIIGKKNYAIRAVIANTMLSSLSMVLANSLHHKAIFRGNGDRDAIEDLLTEASGTHFHILVASDLVKPSTATKVCIAILQALVIFFYRIISYISPRAAHRTLGYIYEKSISDYSNWIDDINSKTIENIPASKMSISYFNLKDDAMLTDVIDAMRSDNIKYRDDEHKYADNLLLKK